MLARETAARENREVVGEERDGRGERSARREREEVGRSVGGVMVLGGHRRRVLARVTAARWTQTAGVRESDGGSGKPRGSRRAERHG